MTDLELAGCRTAPLAGYLSGLGVLRAVTRVLDPDAAGSWHAQRFVLSSRFETVDALVGELADAFVPESVVSPWNAGSGFAGNGKNATAEGLLRRVRESADPRLRPLADTVRAGDHVVRSGRDSGWGGKAGELWDKTRKPDVLRLCRNTFPDHALPWVDAAVSLGSAAEPTYSRLLGTGGNFGRQDLSATYLQRALDVLSDRRSGPWLHAALTGDESVPYLRDTVGQFDPSRAGGVQSSPLEKSDERGFVNPWSFLLTLEGALLFAGAVVRRLGAQFARPSLPFQVRGSTAGFASGAAGETPLGEIWVPEWSEPAHLDQIRHLMTEGRAEWRDGPARSGLDFARAAASLGVDRGIGAFTRHVFVDRHGQSPLAVPAGRIVVRERAGVALLGELDPWLDRLRGGPLPAGPTTGIRVLEERLFGLAIGLDDLTRVFAALGRLTGTVGRSGAVRERCRPLELSRGADLLAELRPALADDLDLRIALAIATLSDRTTATPRPDDTVRPHLHPIRWNAGRKRWEWSTGPAPASTSRGIGPSLAEIARRRAFPGQVQETVHDKVPGVRGVRITFTHGLQLGADDRRALVGGKFDRHRVVDLLDGLLCVRWPVHLGPDGSSGSERPPIPALDALLPFCTSVADRVFVRPGSHWPTLLSAGRGDEVLADATRRLRIGGCGFVVDPVLPDLDPALLAGSLVLPTSARQRRAALGRIRFTPDGQESA